MPHQNSHSTTLPQARLETSPLEAPTKRNADVNLLIDKSALFAATFAAPYARILNVITLAVLQFLHCN
eukprot:IDg9030t1